MFISNDIVSAKIYSKRNNFDFEVVNFPFLDGDVPRLHPVEFIFLNSSGLLAVADTNDRNNLLTQKLLKQGYLYHKLRNFFSKILNSMSDLNLSSIRNFQIQLMAT